MTPETIQTLQQLLALHSRSFPNYLQYSRPHAPPNRREALETVLGVAEDQQAMAGRIGRLLTDARVLPRTGEFPMDYTDSHDLSVDYVLRTAVAYQQQDIEAMEAMVARLRTAPAAKAVAEEALGMAKGHLELLQEAAATTAPN